MQLPCGTNIRSTFSSTNPNKTYRTVSTEAVFVLAGILLPSPPIELVAGECKKVYSATHRIDPNSGKALPVRRKERRVTLCKWMKWLSGSSKGEWTRLLIRNLKVWLERGHGKMNFYLTQVMSSRGAFNGYLFRMKLAESSNAPTAIE